MVLTLNNYLMSYFNVSFDKEAKFLLLNLIKYCFYQTVCLLKFSTKKKKSKNSFLFTNSKRLIHIGHRNLATELGF